MAKLFVQTSSQYLTVNSAPVTAAAFSVSCWVRPTTLSATQSLVSIGDVDTNNEQWRLTTSAGQKARWSAQTSAGEAFATSTASLVTGTWAHVCGVETSATSRAVWLNGTSNTNTTNRSPAGADTLRIGAKVTTGTLDSADGDIAEVAVWNAALSSAEIAILAAGYSPLFVRPESLVFYMPLVRSDVEVVGGLAMTAVASPTVSNHVRVFNPSRPYYSLPAAAGGTGYTQSVTGVVTPTGAVIKQTSRALTAGIAPAGALVKLTSRDLTGAVATAGTLVNQAQKVLAGTVASAGALTKQTSRALTGAVGFAGALTAVRTILLSLAGAVGLAGGLSRQTNRELTGTVTPGGTVTRLTSRALTAVLSFSGGLAKQTARALTGAVGFAGAIASEIVSTAIHYVSVTLFMPQGAGELEFPPGAATLELPPGDAEAEG